MARRKVLRPPDGKHFDLMERCKCWKHGMSIGEISKVMGIERGNVKLILYRALRKMRERNPNLAEYL